MKEEMVVVRRIANVPRTVSIGSIGLQFDVEKDEFEVPRRLLAVVLHKGNFKLLLNPTSRTEVEPEPKLVLDEASVVVESKDSGD